MTRGRQKPTPQPPTTSVNNCTFDFTMKAEANLTEAVEALAHAAKANAEAIQTIAFILNGGQGAKTGLIVGNVTDKGF